MATASDGLHATGLIEGRLAFDLGTLPGPSIGPGLAGGVALRRLRARLGALYLPPRFAKAPADAGQGTRGAAISLAASSVEGCYAALEEPVEIDVCAMVEGGALIADGSGFEHTKRVVTAWVAGGGSVEVVWRRLDPLTLRLGVGGMAPFGRSRVRFQNDALNPPEKQEFYRPGGASMRAVLTVGLSFE